MARINGVSSDQAGLYVRIAYRFTRHGIGRLTGRETERMIEPLEMYAHLPVLFNGYAKLKQATAKLHRLDKRLHALAELKAATLTHCEYCIDMGSAIARRWGLTDQELLALPNHRTSPLFSELDKLVLDYAVGMSRTPAEVPDELFDKLRRHLDEAHWSSRRTTSRWRTCAAGSTWRSASARPVSATAWYAPYPRSIRNQRQRRRSAFGSPPGAAKAGKASPTRFNPDAARREGVGRGRSHDHPTCPTPGPKRRFGHTLAAAARIEVAVVLRARRHVRTLVSARADAWRQLARSTGSRASSNDGVRCRGSLSALDRSVAGGSGRGGRVPHALHRPRRGQRCAADRS